MAGAYSTDLRSRVLAAVEARRAPRRRPGASRWGARRRTTGRRRRARKGGARPTSGWAAVRRQRPETGDPGRGGGGGVRGAPRPGLRRRRGRGRRRPFLTRPPGAGAARRTTRECTLNFVSTFVPAPGLTELEQCIICNFKDRGSAPARGVERGKGQRPLLSLARTAVSPAGGITGRRRPGLRPPARLPGSGRRHEQPWHVTAPACLGAAGRPPPGPARPSSSTIPGGGPARTARR